MSHRAADEGLVYDLPQQYKCKEFNLYRVYTVRVVSEESPDLCPSIDSFWVHVSARAAVGYHIVYILSRVISAEREVRALIASIKGRK